MSNQTGQFQFSNKDNRAEYNYMTVAKVQLQGVLKTLTITILAKQGPLTKVRKRETKQKMGISAL